LLPGCTIPLELVSSLVPAQVGLWFSFMAVDAGVSYSQCSMSIDSPDTPSVHPARCVFVGVKAARDGH
jgi:hypothetical protein